MKIGILGAGALVRQAEREGLGSPRIPSAELLSRVIA